MKVGTIAVGIEFIHLKMADNFKFEIILRFLTLIYLLDFRSRLHTHLVFAVHAVYGIFQVFFFYFGLHLLEFYLGSLFFQNLI